MNPIKPTIRYIEEEKSETVLRNCKSDHFEVLAPVKP